MVDSTVKALTHHRTRAWCTRNTSKVSNATDRIVEAHRGCDAIDRDWHDKAIETALCRTVSIRHQLSRAPSIGEHCTWVARIGWARQRRSARCRRRRRRRRRCRRRHRRRSGGLSHRRCARCRRCVGTAEILWQRIVARRSGREEATAGFGAARCVEIVATAVAAAVGRRRHATRARARDAERRGGRVGALVLPRPAQVGNRAHGTRAEIAVGVGTHDLARLRAGARAVVAVRDYAVAVGGGAVGVALAAAGFRNRDAHASAVGAIVGHLALGVVAIAAHVGTLRVGRAAVGSAVVVGRTRQRVAEVFGARIVVVDVHRCVRTEAGARAQRRLTLVVAGRTVGVHETRERGVNWAVGERSWLLLCVNNTADAEREQKSVKHHCCRCWLSRSHHVCRAHSQTSMASEQIFITPAACRRCRSSSD